MDDHACDGNLLMPMQYEETLSASTVSALSANNHRDFTEHMAQVCVGLLLGVFVTYVWTRFAIFLDQCYRVRDNSLSLSSRKFCSF